MSDTKARGAEGWKTLCPYCGKTNLVESKSKWSSGTYRTHESEGCPITGVIFTAEEWNRAAHNSATTAPKAERNESPQASGVSKEKEAAAKDSSLSEILADWREQIIDLDERGLISDTPAARSFIGDVKKWTPPASDQSYREGFEADIYEIARQAASKTFKTALEWATHYHIILDACRASQKLHRSNDEGEAK